MQLFFESMCLFFNTVMNLREGFVVFAKGCPVGEFGCTNTEGFLCEKFTWSDKIWWSLTRISGIRHYARFCTLRGDAVK